MLCWLAQRCCICNSIRYNIVKNTKQHFQISHNIKQYWRINISIIWYCCILFEIVLVQFSDQFVCVYCSILSAIMLNNNYYKTHNNIVQYQRTILNLNIVWTCISLFDIVVCWTKQNKFVNNIVSWIVWCC